MHLHPHLHQGFLRGMRQRGGLVVTGKRITRLERSKGLWAASAGEFSISGRIVVNAAGAWAGEVGDMSGAGPIGLVPKRRTAIIEAGSSLKPGPMVLLMQQLLR